MDIINITKRSLKYTLLRAYIKHMRKKAERKNLSETQEVGIMIAKKLIYSSDAEIIIAPLSDVCYIRKEDIFLKLSRDSLQIINGKYLYDIYIPSDWHMELTNGIYQRMESKKKSIENKIKNRSARSLKNILEDINANHLENVKIQ